MLDEYSINHSPAKEIATATAKLSEATQSNATESAQSEFDLPRTDVYNSEHPRNPPRDKPGKELRFSSKNTSPLLICICIYNVHVHIQKDTGKRCPLQGPLHATLGEGWQTVLADVSTTKTNTTPKEPTATLQPELHNRLTMLSPTKIAKAVHQRQ